MKYLVTGGAGFIGSHLVDKLIEDGHSVAILDNLSTGQKENINPRAEFHLADIVNFTDIQALFRGLDGVFHLAAIPRVPVSVEDPIGTSQVNIMGTLNVFKASQEAGVKRVVFASSSSVYGNQKEMPLREDMMSSPVSPYGLQKSVGEQLAKLFSELYNLPVVSLRFFNVYGPRVDFNSDYSLVLGKFLRQKSQGKSLTVCGNGEQTRGFCFVTDVVAAIIKAIEVSSLKGGEIINVGGGKSHSVNYLASLISSEIEYIPERPGDVLHTSANTEKAKALLGWEANVSLEEGVAITKKWFEQRVKN